MTVFAGAGLPTAVNVSSRPGDRAGRRRLHLPVKLLLLAVVALAVVWSGLLPQQLGGRMAFAITDGISMLPRYHSGDLVILQKESSYHVGEVAAYHNRQFHAVVLHRIIAIRGRHYVFKGDNNSWVTTFQPTKAQIIGAQWLHLPRAGRLVLDLRTPAIAAALLGVLWLVSFSPAARSRRRRRRHRHAR